VLQKADGWSKFETTGLASALCYGQLGVVPLKRKFVSKINDTGAQIRRHNHDLQERMTKG